MGLDQKLHDLQRTPWAVRGVTRQIRRFGETGMKDAIALFVAFAPAMFAWLAVGFLLVDRLLPVHDAEGA